jgi:UDP-N-acetylmuramoylalanine--D-glutamate ligase
MEYKGKKITVVGLARSGVAAALLLKKQGAIVFGSDAGKPDEAFLTQLIINNVEFETGYHSAKAYDADMFVVSPGVPLKAPIIVDAKRRGIIVIGELELASALTLADIVAVTGSNGKSTTVSLLGELFKTASFKSRVCGNIGLPLSNEIEGLGAGDVLIAEVSSFQLDSTLDFHPRTAAILNLTPDHLDSYPDVNAYYDSKLRITKNQSADDLLVLNADDPITEIKRKNLSTSSRIAEFSISREVNIGALVKNGAIIVRDGNTEKIIISIRELKLPGTHNISNVLAALSIAMPYHLSVEAVREVLRSFRGVEHRIEWTREINGVNFWNDSKGTNLDSVRVALLSMNGPIHLIAGGRDKAGDFSALNNLVSTNVKVVYAIGEAAPIVENAWKEITDVKMVGRMEDAVKLASSLAIGGENVLLSPGCASYDQYKNYEERGRHFKKLVGEL